MFGGFDRGLTIDSSVDNTIGKECRDNYRDKGIYLAGSKIERWGLGIVQEIDTAAMSVWAKYASLDPEISFVELDAGSHNTQEYEDLSAYSLSS